MIPQLREDWFDKIFAPPQPTRITPSSNGASYSWTYCTTLPQRQIFELQISRRVPGDGYSIPICSMCIILQITIGTQFGGVSATDKMYQRLDRLA